MWLSLFSAYPGGSPSQLIRIKWSSAVLSSITAGIVSLHNYCTSVYEHALFFGFWPVTFSGGMRVASRMYSDCDCGLADATKQTPCPCRLTYRVGPHASSAEFFIAQKVTNYIYLYVRGISSYWSAVRREAPCRCWKRVVTVVLIFTSCWWNVLTFPKFHSRTKGSLIFTKHAL